MTSDMSASDYLRRYYEQRPTGIGRKGLERIARGFRRDARLEQLLALPHDTREALLAKDPGLRISLGGYEQRKAAHEQLEALR